MASRARASASATIRAAATTTWGFGCCCRPPSAEHWTAGLCTLNPCPLNRAKRGCAHFSQVVHSCTFAPSPDKPAEHVLAQSPAVGVTDMVDPAPDAGVEYRKADPPGPPGIEAVGQTPCFTGSRSSCFVIRILEAPLPETRGARTRSLRPARWRVRPVPRSILARAAPREAELHGHRSRSWSFATRRSITMST